MTSAPLNMSALAANVETATSNTTNPNSAAEPKQFEFKEIRANWGKLPEQMLSDLKSKADFVGNPKPVRSLTSRQGEVLEYLVQGRSNKEIARSLRLGLGTVKIHVACLFRSLGVTNRVAAAVAGVGLEKAQAQRDVHALLKVRQIYH